MKNEPYTALGGVGLGWEGWVFGWGGGGRAKGEGDVEWVPYTVVYTIPTTGSEHVHISGYSTVNPPGHR